MNQRRQMLVEALWKTVVLFYRDPDDRSGDDSNVTIPVVESSEALLTCVANIVAQHPDAATRHKIIAGATPAIGKVASARQSKKLIIPETGFLLPN